MRLNQRELNAKKYKEEKLAAWKAKGLKLKPKNAKKKKKQKKVKRKNKYA